MIRFVFSRQAATPEPTSEGDMFYDGGSFPDLFGLKLSLKKHPSV